MGKIHCKTIMSYHYTPTRRVNIKWISPSQKTNKWTNKTKKQQNVGQNAEQLKFPYTAGRSINLYNNNFGKLFIKIFFKLKVTIGIAMTQ